MRQVDIKMTPTNTKFTVETGSTKQTPYDMSCYADTYHVELSGNWYQPQTLDVVVDEPIENVDVLMVYKTGIDGNQDDCDSLIWSKENEVIIDGNN